MCYDYSLCRFSGNTIQNTSVRGVDIASSDATFAGDSLSNNAGVGMFMTNGSNVIGQNMTIQNNGGGVSASAGMLVGVSWNVSNNVGDGIFGNSSLHFQLIDSVLQNNTFNGIDIVAHSDVSLENDTVTGNGLQGLRLSNIVYAYLSGGTYTANGGWPDIRCDGQYTGVGNLSGASYGSTNCVQQTAATASAK
jgi:hypothetical protein